MDAEEERCILAEHADELTTGSWVRLYLGDGRIVDVDPVTRRVRLCGRWKGLHLYLHTAEAENER